MKAMHTLAAVVVFLAFTATAASANPAMMKKHPGYPSDDGKSTTATGDAASLKGAEDAPVALKEQLKSAETPGLNEQLKHSGDSRLPAVQGSGYVHKGVTENMIPEATKTQANRTSCGEKERESQAVRLSRSSPAQTFTQGSRKNAGQARKNVAVK